MNDRNDRPDKFSSDPINKDREEKEKYNRNNADTDQEDSEKKGLMDKIMDFFSPEDDSEKPERDQNIGPTNRDDTFQKQDNIRDPLYTPNRETRTKGMMESDYDNGEKDKVLVGIFDNENEAINVITRLNEIGYWEDEISAVAKDKNRMDYTDDTTDFNTKTQGSEGKVGTGTATVGSRGGLAVVLPELGLVEIPGFGPTFAAGPITGVISDVVVGSGAGGLVDGLVQMGVKEEAAKEYEQYIKQGKILVLVENRDFLQEDITTTFKQNNSIINYESRTRELAGSRV